MTWGAIAAGAASAVAGVGATKLLGGGGGGGGGNSRIPGQTQAGEYTPPAGGFGTYNYIPTGATQIDPQLIQAILGSLSGNQGAINAGTTQNNNLMFQGMNNPYAGLMQGRSQTAGDQAYQAGINSNNSAALLAQYMPTIMQGGMNTAFATGNLLRDAQNNPFAANTIANSANIGQGMQTAGADLAGGAQGYLGGVQGQVNSLLANPYLQQAQAGANTAGGMMQNTGTSGYGQGQVFSNAAMSGLPAIQQTLGTAFDPQQQLYDRTARQTQDQLGVFLANSGLTNSGAGAGIMSDALNNFNINWQDRQLGRQTQGLGAYNTAMSNLGSNLGTGQDLQTGAAGTYASGAALPGQTYQNIGSNQLQNLGALGSALGTAGNVMSGAQQMQLQGANTGYTAYNNDLANQLGFAQAYGNSVGQLGTLGGQVGSMGNTAANLNNNAVNNFSASGQLPYNAYQTIYGNNNQALGNYLGNQTDMSNLGNQSIGQMMSYLQSVMSGAGNAANAANGAQSNQLGMNANAMGMISRITDPASTAFGNWVSRQFGGSNGSTAANPGYGAQYGWG